MLTDDLFTALRTLTADHSVENMFLLTDTNAQKFCLKQVADILNLKKEHIFVIPFGEEQKKFSTVQTIWQKLIENNANRQSLLICLGGGVICDVGAFTAATYMRGIDFVHIPTTLLAMVDASIGGKAGFDFMGIKNVIGVFKKPLKTIVFPDFLETLPSKQLLSGYAEVLKHALIASPLELQKVLDFDLQSFKIPDFIEILERSMAIKEYFVEQDPEEKNIRKALNLGHTAGHAFESWALSRKPYLHGYAVAWGLICELYLSCIKTGFPTDKMRQTVRFIKENYGELPITCDDYEELYQYMTHDKKNTAGIINFTLLGDVGDIRINQSADKKEIFEMLDFFRDGN